MESPRLSCPFCDARDDVILSNALAFSCQDHNPVTPGHMLLIPFRHVPSYFEITHEEHAALFQLVDQGKKWIDARHHPDGYNIGINIGETAGQTIMHVHVHLIPRYKGDVAFPRGGVRGVIPDRQSY